MGLLLFTFCHLLGHILILLIFYKLVTANHLFVILSVVVFDNLLINIVFNCMPVQSSCLTASFFFYNLIIKLGILNPVFFRQFQTSEHMARW